MSRMHLARAAATAMAGLSLLALLATHHVHAQLTYTDAYLLRALGTMQRYANPIERAGSRGDVLTASRLCKACAAELYAIPIFGVDPQVVSTVRSAARVYDSLGSALLELNDPTVPEALKQARAIDLLARLADLADQLERLQR